MSLETGTYVQDLVQTNPPGTDKKKQGDDHLRLIKDVLKNTFPNATRAMRFPRSRNVTATGNINSTDMHASVTADATGGAIVLTLPSLAAGDDGWTVRVMKTDASANTVTISGTINGAANLVISRRYDEAYVEWTGSAWIAGVFRASIGPSDLETDAVTNAKVANDAINTNEIVNLAVTTGKLADNSVNAAKIVDGVVSAAKLTGSRMTIQVLSAGTAATYTTPANCKTILAIEIGGGGGGGGTGGGGSAAGTATTFDGVDAAPGQGGGSVTGNAGAGGTGGSGSALFRMPGGGGISGDGTCGGAGGSGLFGAGAGRGVASSAGANGGANTGAGGGGGHSGGSGSSGGGAGEVVFILRQSPAATYTYTIGAGGAGGGGVGGGTGGSGVILVLEFY
jgi:hypothetical protein